MKITMKVDVDPSLLKYDAATMLKNVEQELKVSIFNAERTAKEIVPKKTGALANSIHHGGGGLSWWARTQLEYAEYIEEGTSAHIIIGNEWLYWEGADHPVHMVNHPGNAAYKYMETALYIATEDIEERIYRALTI